MPRTSLIIQGGGARPTTTNQSQRTDQDLQNAARDLREAIRNNINAQAIRARAQGAAAAAQDGQATPATPTPPTMPSMPSMPSMGGEVLIRGQNGEPVISVRPPFGRNNGIPPQAVDISIAFFITMAAIIVGLPLARAFARRMDRHSGTAQIPTEITSQLTQLNHAVDAIALEVERISEGQRFTARLLSEERNPARQTLPSGADR